MADGAGVEGIGGGMADGGVGAAEMDGEAVDGTRAGVVVTAAGGGVGAAEGVGAGGTAGAVATTTGGGRTDGGRADGEGAVAVTLGDVPALAAELAACTRLSSS